MKKELTHNHKMTNILKTLIFSILMLAPFFAIGVKCWYVANNENAKDSYRGNYSFDSNVIVTNTEEYQLEKEYFLATNNATIADAFSRGNNESGCLYKTFIISYQHSNNTRTINSSTLSYDYYWIGNNGYIYGKNINNNINTEIYNYVAGDIINKATISFYNLDHISQMKINYWQYPTFYVDTTLSSVFYSAVQELDKASIFSWTVDTAIYTAVNNMCVALGIVSPPLAVLITYWTLLTIIYVVIDIVIEVFIFLTHWFNDKMV